MSDINNGVQCCNYYNSCSFQTVENDIILAFNSLGFKDKVKVMNYILKLLKNSIS